MTESHDNHSLQISAPMALAEARRRIDADVTPVQQLETLPLAQALHRVLARPVISKVNVPSADNSAMDGYGYAAQGVTAGQRLQVVGQALAGHPWTGRVGTGECVRITTGAVVPAGVDAVVMQENTQTVDDGHIIIDKPTAPGANIRAAGEDVTRGQAVLGAGHFLRPADIAVLASVGAARVSVYRRLRVAFFSTGDELRPLDAELASGELHDSNRHGLAAQLAELGVEAVDLGVVEDSPDALAATFDQAAECDAIISSGGVSVGSADHVLATLQAKGRVNFWKVAIKPGKPLAFGTVGRARFFGLPGNPVSTAVTFMQLVRPALIRMAGGVPAPPLRFSLPVAADLPANGSRENFLRARLDYSGTQPQAVPLHRQGSGVMRSMSQADAFIVLAPNTDPVAAGQAVTVEPFEQASWARIISRDDV